MRMRLSDDSDLPLQGASMPARCHGPDRAPPVVTVPIGPLSPAVTAVARPLLAHAVAAVAAIPVCGRFRGATG